MTCSIKKYLFREMMLNLVVFTMGSLVLKHEPDL